MSLKKPGPPRLVIPQELIDALEETYEQGIPNSVPVDDPEDGIEFINASKRYAKRTDRSFRSNWSADGKILSFALTDKRTYTRSNLEREK